MLVGASPSQQALDTTNFEEEFTAQPIRVLQAPPLGHHRFDTQEQHQHQQLQRRWQEDEAQPAAGAIVVATARCHQRPDSSAS